MELVRCDHCKKEVRETHPVGWVTVQPAVDVRTFGTDAGPWHLCSAACLAAWAATRAA